MSTTTKMQYGVSEPPFVRCWSETDIALSPPWELGSQGVEDHPRMYVLWRPALAGVGPSRGGGDQTRQICVREVVYCRLYAH